MPSLDIQPETPSLTPTRTVAFRTIGCRLNQCETAQMQESLQAEGYRLVDWDEHADIRVINTCTVTHKSDRTCRHEIRAAKRFDPDCVMIAAGCYAQVDADAVAAIEGVDLVLGNLDKLQLPGYLAGLLDGHGPQPPGGAGPTGADAAPPVSATKPPLVAVTPYPDHPSFEGEQFSHFYGYTRAFLKIQNGCDARCAYCVIPLARGPARSMPKNEVVAQVRLLAARDYREVVLTGIHLGMWGRDTGEGSLADLLTLLLAQGGADRYRLSSLEPLEADEALQEAVLRGGDRVAHHFHLPLQSGADSVLRRMNRPYTASQYLEVVTSLARRFPDAALGADVITGFPGETDSEFEDTFSFIEHSPLTHLHVFSYSDRPGTHAFNMRPKVHVETIHERTLRLRAMGENKKAAFRGRLVGTEQRVLVLKERTADGRLVGLTGNYMEVLVTTDERLTNHFVRMRLERALPDGRWEATFLRTEAPPAAGDGGGGPA
ncbi:MAG: tRNA (N(6)-L-threonylcarbamoyladenosine(37)-C(2))-methylthiotransferase MtaB [Thermoleophilia bacterium]|nr:tRNA (N(6)-L-threonylcarbamoyladenosine(37)-C(2))-methylthiotransferase MtaB [Thermoleophilia bacterium]